MQEVFEKIIEKLGIREEKSEKKEKVTRLDVIVTGTAIMPYYEIKYTTLDGVTHIGYSSYRLSNVLDWKKRYFELVGKQFKKKTNFDRCCESTEAMEQIIDIAKIGWTKDQIMEWLQKEVCEIPEPYSKDLAGDSITNADRIRSMSDKEIEELIVGLSAHCLAGIGACDCSGVKTQPCYEACGEITRKWLQSEVEE